MASTPTNKRSGGRPRAAGAELAPAPLADRAAEDIALEGQARALGRPALALEQTIATKNLHLMVAGLLRFHLENERANAQAFAQLRDQIGQLQLRFDQLLGSLEVAPPGPALEHLRLQSSEAAHQIANLVRIYGALVWRHDELIAALQQLAAGDGQWGLVQSLEQLASMPEPAAGLPVPPAAPAVVATPLSPGLDLLSARVATPAELAQLEAAAAAAGVAGDVELKAGQVVEGLPPRVVEWVRLSEADRRLAGD